MNIMLNSLPTRTWNHLHMNETRASVDQDFTNFDAAVVCRDSAAAWNPAARWNHPETAWALSQGLSGLMADAAQLLAETAPGQKMKSPMVLTYAYGAGERGMSKLVLHAARDSRLQAVVLLQGDCRASALQTEILAEENAQVDLYVAQLLDRDSTCYHEVSGLCLENARVCLTRLELGAAKSYTGASLDLLGKGSDFTTEIGYHGRENQLLDMNYVSLHHGEKTTCLMEVHGTLEEHARKLFRGTIDFQRGAKGAKGTENENVLLMGDDLVNQTIPLILCKEEDVEGNHGASIGRLDEKVLFYLGSRGISREAAREIIARARIEALCNKFPDEDVRKAIHTFEYGKKESDAEF